MMISVSSEPQVEIVVEATLIMIDSMQTPYPASYRGCQRSKGSSHRARDVWPIFIVYAVFLRKEGKTEIVQIQ